MAKEFGGFYNPVAKQVYIDLGKKPDQQVATMVHELLHASASGDFGATLGREIDEGMTEKLTQEAFKKSGYAPPSGFFVGQVGMVNQISALVGENTMKHAYFNGTSAMASMMNARLGEGIFKRFAIEVRNKNWGWLEKFFDRYARAMGGAEADKKIAAINSLLDGWVTDEDLDNIENIWNGSTPDEKSQMRAAIAPRVLSLIDLGQRTRLRLIMAS